MGYSQHFQSKSPGQFIFYGYEAISPPIDQKYVCQRGGCNMSIERIPLYLVSSQ